MGEYAAAELRIEREANRSGADGGSGKGGKGAETGEERLR